MAADQFDLAPRAFFKSPRQNLFGKNRSFNVFTSVSLHLQGRDAGTPTTADLTEYRVLGTYREPRLLNTAADGSSRGTRAADPHRASISGGRARRRRPLSASIARQRHRAATPIQRTELLAVKVSADDRPFR